MTTALATVPEVTEPRELALLKAVGLDRLNREQQELALNIASRYELDLLLKHLVMIEGRPYITRDGLLHVAHRSGVLDGMETTDPVLADGFWRATCSVYRKDMSRPFTYSGRYPEQGQNRKFAPEMAVKVAEVMALRRAFDVAAPTAEERWDVPEAVVDTESVARPTLAERVQERAEAISAEEAAEIVEAETAEADVDLTAEAQRIFSEDEIAPAGGLTSTELQAKAREAHVLTPVLAAKAKELFPDLTKLGELTDQQRYELWEAVKP